MTALIDLTGKTFGNWTVVKRSDEPNIYTFWQCKCKCGKVKNVASQHLRYGNSKQCLSCSGKKST